MIRIDEIYNNVFWPYIKTNVPHTSMYHFDPPGRTDPDSIISLLSDKWLAEKNFVFLFDQEPINPLLHSSTFKNIDNRNLNFRNSPDRKKGALIVSETDSDNLDYICSTHNLQPFYYFFHGWAALDWYRGYNRTFLNNSLGKRKINKTFISPNRIIGGMRQHRVLMLYHFQRLNLMNNWISASRICPVEGTDILDIALEYKNVYPDIVDMLSTADLPKLFPNESLPKMSSYCLDQFDIANECLLYHVSETVYFGRRSHLTEKTFKPIALGMPFVLSAPAGSLAYLKKYGFKTFSDVWSEEYDHITDDIQRTEAVAELLHYLDNCNNKQELFERCIPMVEHNYQWFYKGDFEQVLWCELNNMLTDLREYLK
jgi:hypothetical protein